MSKIGVHSFVWSASSSRADLEKALDRTREAGFDLVEFSYLDPAAVDVKWLAGRIRELGLDVAVSMGLPLEGDISSEDAAVIRHGEAILDRAVALTPGIESPTISPLHRQGWVAVQAMVLRTEVHRIMDELYDCGARAILVTDIHACRL